MRIFALTGLSRTGLAVERGEGQGTGVFHCASHFARHFLAAQPGQFLSRHPFRPVQFSIARDLAFRWSRASLHRWLRERSKSSELLVEILVCSFELYLQSIVEYLAMLLIIAGYDPCLNAIPLVGYDGFASGPGGCGEQSVRVRRTTVFEFSSMLCLCHC